MTLSTSYSDSLWQSFLLHASPLYDYLPVFYTGLFQVSAICSLDEARTSRQPCI